MRVEVDIHQTELEDDEGREVDSVRAECTRCGHDTESYGISDRSRRRCLVLMREGCPRGERNFYVDADGTDY
jgi:hypothetical protein